MKNPSSAALLGKNTGNSAIFEANKKNNKTMMDTKSHYYSWVPSSSRQGTVPTRMRAFP